MGPVSLGQSSVNPDRSSAYDDKPVYLHLTDVIRDFIVFRFSRTFAKRVM